MNRLIPTLSSAVLGLLTANVAGQAVEAKPATNQKNIVETALAAGQFKTLAKALTAGKLVGALQGKGPFTVFAPTDAAFAKVPAATMKSLLDPKNIDQLKAILTYHVVPGKVMAKTAVKLPSAKTLNGQKAAISAGDEGVTIAGCKIVKTDIECSNGVIHVVDSVMMPELRNLAEVATKAGSFGTLLAAVKAGGLVDTVANGGPFTVFAPTDAAFEKLPKGTVASLLKPENKAKLVAILKHHIVPGRVFSTDLSNNAKVATANGTEISVAINEKGVQISGSSVVSADVPAANGVIHVVDAVILPETKK